jgi:FkbM family methyltransferase
MYFGDYVNEAGKKLDELIKEYFPENFKGIFFDIGAYDPIQISNSYYFEINGWDTYLFEANPNLIDNLKNKRKNVFNYAIAETDKDLVRFNIYNQKWNDSWNKVASFSSIDLDYLKLDAFKEHNNVAHEIITIEVEQRSLNSILKNELNYIKNIDVLEIDIEGGEFNCLKGFDLNIYSPKLIVLENIYDPDNNIEKYLKKFNYKLDKKYSHNEFYVNLN